MISAVASCSNSPSSIFISISISYVIRGSYCKRVDSSLGAQHLQCGYIMPLIGQRVQHGSILADACDVLMTWSERLYHAVKIEDAARNTHALWSNHVSWEPGCQ